MSSLEPKPFVCDAVAFIQSFCLAKIDDSWFGVFFELALFAMAFAGLSIVCDEYLAPALELLCKRRQIPEHIAGATFMALASGIPELVISSIVALQTKIEDEGEGHPELAVATIIGSGLIAFLVIPAMCVLSTPKLECQPGPLLRDVGFYMFGLCMLGWFLADNHLQRHESSLLVLAYFTYLAVVLLPHFLKTSSSPVLRRMSTYMGGAAAREVELSAAEAAEEAPVALTGQSSQRRCLFAPLHLLQAILERTNEDTSGDDGRYCVAIMKGFAWVTFFSFCITSVCGRWSEMSGASSGLFGAVVVAIGAQIPDIVQSVAVAKRGMGSMAMGNAIGSQNFNMLFCLSLPWCIGGDVKFEHFRVMRISGVLAFISTIIFSAVAFSTFCQTGMAVVEKKQGMFLGGAYFVCLCILAIVSLAP